MQAGLLALDLARIARQVAVPLQQHAEIRIDLDERARDAVADGARLSGQATAVHAHAKVVLAFDTGDLERRERDRLPDPARMSAQMFIRGTDIHIPLTFARIQPYVSPKIQLSDQRQERVDLRVLPVIFSFQPPRDVRLYPGQLVDVYVGEK